jgi:hypothetical protein
MSAVISHACALRCRLSPLQNLVHRPGFVLLHMRVVAIKNSAKNQVDRHTFESPTHKTLAGECNRLVAMLAPAEHDRGTTPALRQATNLET